MNNHFTIQRQLLFARIMRQSLCLHEALPNIAIKYIFRGIEVYE